MNEFLLWLGAGHTKPLLTALLLPPTPFIVLVLAGAWALRTRRAAGWTLVLLACAGLWFSATWAAADGLTRVLLAPPPALAAPDIAALRQAAASAPGRHAIVVLGGGRDELAPEYGTSSLSAASLERLRYGVWLARATGIPLAFSGGLGRAARGDAPEAEVAARIAAQEFGRPIKWLEPGSRDTRENAVHAVRLLRAAGVRHLVVVTHGWHMPRSMRAFVEAGGHAGDRIEVTAAPMGLARAVEHPALHWMPAGEGQLRVRQVLREWLGWVAGA